MIQTYSIRRESIKWTKKAKRSGKKVKRYLAKKSNYRYVAKNLPVAPPNIGPKTFPNYQAFVNGAIRNLKGGGKVFAGPRDDPFFVDLGGTFDAINIRQLTGNQGKGKDDLSGFSVSSTVLLVPESAVTRDGKPVKSAAASNSVIGVWSTTDRKRVQVTNADFDQGGLAQGQGQGRGPGVAPGQPAGERGRDPAGQEGPVQPHHPGSRRRAVRQVRRQAGAGGRS